MWYAPKTSSDTDSDSQSEVQVESPRWVLNSDQCLLLTPKRLGFELN